MKTKYILTFIFLSLSHQLLPAEKPLSLIEKKFFELCSNGDLNSIKKFLEQHSTIDINAKSKYGNTALHIICNQAYNDKKKKRQACKTVRMLIQKGANPNLQNLWHSYTPLHCACIHNTNSLIKTLINNKADINKQDKSGRTALHLICNKTYCDKKKKKKACEIATMLIQKGANPNLQTINYGYIPLHYACQTNNKSLIKILINNGTNIARATESAALSPYQMLSIPYNIRNKFSSEPILFEPMYVALFDTSNQKNPLATSLLPEIAHIIKNFYLDLCLNDFRPEAWIWEPVCIEACAEAYKKDKIELDNVKSLKECLARILFWPKEKKLAINAILQKKYQGEKKRLFDNIYMHHLDYL